MGKNRSFAIRPKKEFEQLFNETIKTAYDVFGTDAFKYRKGVLASLFDTTMVGLARRLERGQLCDIKEAKAR